jgi:DNA-binding NarL/FixJ family response regulator
MTLCLPLMRADADDERDETPEPIRPLTPTQERIVDLLGEGFPAPVVAERLAMSLYTVRAHIRALSYILTGRGPALARIRAFARRRRAA